MPRAKEGYGLVAILAISIAGCSKPSPPPYTEFGEPAPRVAPQSRGFDAYLSAAATAEERASKYVTRTSFTPGQREAVISALAPQVSQIARASSVVFEFEPTKPFEPRPHRQGFKLLGNAMAWRIEALVKAGRMDEAASLTLVATRFGFNLTGGSATDAALGFSIVDDARKAMLPGLPRVSSAQLAAFANGLESALDQKPPMERAIQNERLNMLAAIDDLQDAYRKKDFGIYEERLGADILPAVKYLKELPDTQKRSEFFASLANEANAMTIYFASLTKLNARQRVDAKAPDRSETRPWRRWARALFRGPEPLFDIQDRTVARTRILATYASALAISKKAGIFPTTINKTGSTAYIDPFTGESLIYRTDGRQLRVYSVGSDFRDDGGETNESFESPDLTLESNDL